MKKLHGILKIYKMIWKYEPFYLVCSFPQTILTAAQALLAAYFTKLFIEQLMGESGYGEVLEMILLYALLLLLVSGLNIFLKNKTEFFSDRFAKKVRETTGGITMGLPLEVMEGADFHDRLYMANNVKEVLGAAALLQGILADLFTVAGLAAVIARLDFLFVLLIGAVLAVKVCLVYLMQKRLAMRRISFAQNDRKGNYLNGVAYFNKGAAKELRLNNLQPWFMGKIREYREEMLGLQYGDFGRYALADIFLSVVMGVQTFFMLWVLSLQYLDGSITIADFTMYFSAVTVVSASLSRVIEKFGEYNRMQLYLWDFDSIRKEEKTGAGKELSDLEDRTIRFEDVSFMYPGAGQYSLEHINIQIAENEKLAIVGENGAGKSTFIKLLCRFYHPTEGRITIGGTDIWELSDAAFGQLLSAVFQDYRNFAFTIGENVAMREAVPEKEVLSVLEQVGLSEKISRLPHGIRSYLSKNFDREGTDLSGGEGQKLAIARALYKDTPVVILDEPTASLDPQAENEIYENFFHAARNRTALFISHRLAASIRADHIAVFASGKIVEYGTHGELMERNGVYADMFRKQGQIYWKEAFF